MASAFGSGDPAPRRSADRVRVIVYPALVLLAVGALALRAGWINTGAAAGSPRYVRLGGLTGERQPMSVWLDGGGRVHELEVKLIGLCENGGSDPLSWSPESPRITFGATAGPIFAREYNSVRPVGGVPSHSVVWTTARFGKGDRYASGDARFETTFLYPDGRRLRCDSGYVHWAVNRMGTANGSSAPVSSLAVGAPPAQLRFAALVDRTCETTYDEGAARQLRRDREDQPLMKRQRSVVADHERQYLAIARLGEPVTAVDVYRAWLSNMHERIRLESLAVSQRAGGSRQRSEATLAHVGFLKIVGNAHGQEFGLRVCTSNGPLSSSETPGATRGRTLAS